MCSSANTPGTSLARSVRCDASSFFGPQPDNAAAAIAITMLPLRRVIRLDLGVYIHYPWCRKLCPYCDFAVAVARKRPIPHEDYLAAVLAELADRAPEFAGRRLLTIYFGGGTPSLWPAACLGAVIASVRAAFPGGDPPVE